MPDISRSHMLVSIDESGSPGTKQGEGATGLFTIAIVLFEREEQASEAVERIAKLRRELHLLDSFEFHFNDAKARTRIAFFESIALVEFAYFAVTVDKTAPRPATLKNPSVFYRHA